MDPAPIDLQNDQTFQLIRLPKETIERVRELGSGGKPVGTLIINKDGAPIFQDSESKKTYELISNDNSKTKVDKSDLVEIKPDKREATHLGKVMPTSLISVPRGQI